MLKVKVLLYCLIIIILIGCTPYQPMAFMGGYSDIQLNENTYKVSFRGNGFTSPYQVQNDLLHRCAQLTNSRGYQYFIVLARNEKHNDFRYRTPTTINTYSHGNIYGNDDAYTNNYGYQSYKHSTFNGEMLSNSNTTIIPGVTYNIRKYTDTVIIKILKNNKHFPNAFNAKIILAQK